MEEVKLRLECLRMANEKCASVEVALVEADRMYQFIRAGLPQAPKSTASAVGLGGSGGAVGGPLSRGF
jgi:hypothetical protein